MEEDSTPIPTPISDIQNPTKFPGLWYRLHVFIYDLRNFSSDPKAQSRLDSIIDPSYLGTPYFTPAEVSALKQTQLSNGAQTLEQNIQSTLEERLARRMKKRVESGDFRVCAAHDLAPIFEKGFDIDPKKLARDTDFMTLVDVNGLKLKHVVEWSGLVAAGNGKKQQKRQRKKAR